MLGNIGFTELLLILMVCLLVFGAKRLPEIGGSIGKSIREFKRSMSDANEAINAPPDDRLPANRRMDAPSAPSSEGDPKRLSQ
jgi:sec-independent protein translocase protein TatA